MLQSTEIDTINNTYIYDTYNDLYFTEKRTWREAASRCVMCCAIWYHLHNLKNVKNTHERVLIGCFSRFLNCTNGTKSCNTPHIHSRDGLRTRVGANAVKSSTFDKRFALPLDFYSFKSIQYILMDPKKIWL